MGQYHSALSLSSYQASHFPQTEWFTGHAPTAATGAAGANDHSGAGGSSASAKSETAAAAAAAPAATAVAQHYPSFYALLAGTSVAQLLKSVPHPAPILVESSETLKSAFERLLHHNVLGAPVWDVGTKQFVGHIDLRDLVDTIVVNYEQNYQFAADSTESKYPKPAKLNPFARRASLEDKLHYTSASGVVRGPKAAAVMASTPPAKAAPAATADSGATATAVPIVAATQPPAAATTAAAVVTPALSRVQSGAKFLVDIVVRHTGTIEAATVTYLSRRHAFKPLKLSSSLLDVCRYLMGEGHRVPIVDDSYDFKSGAADHKPSSLVAVVTQSSLIQFLSAHITERVRSHVVHAAQTGAAIIDSTADWDAALPSTVGTSPVMCVRDDLRCIDALKLMSARHLSTLPIIDQYTHSLVADLTARDLKCFLRATATAGSAASAHGKISHAHSHSFAAYEREWLEAPVLQFVAAIRRDDALTREKAGMLSHTHTQTVVPVLSVAPNSSLAHVINRLAICKSHKLFVCGSVQNNFAHPTSVGKDVPLRVITLTDVLRVACVDPSTTAAAKPTAAAAAPTSAIKAQTLISIPH